MKSLLLTLIFPMAFLSGCFNNLSEGESSESIKSAQGFLDQGTTPSGAGLVIEATLVSTYREGTSGTGVIAEIGKPLAAKIGSDGMTQLLAHPSATDSIQVGLSSFHIQLSIPTSRLVSGGSLLNIIRITPNRVDFMAGRIQDEAPSIHIATNQNPIVLFGGKIEGSPVDFMSLTFFDPIYQMVGFFPNTVSPTFGVGFPGNSPAGIVPELIPITDTLRGIFSRVFRNPDRTLLGGVPAHFDGVDTYTDQFFMAVYRNAGAIVEAKAIYLSTNPDAAQDAMTFCAARFDAVDDYVYGSGSTGGQILGGDPRSCECFDPLYSTLNTLTVPAGLLPRDPCLSTNRKKQPLLDALAANPPVPRQGYLFSSPTTVSGILIVPKP